MTPRFMGFTDWLWFQVKTYGVGVVSIFVMLVGFAMIVTNQPIIGGIIVILGFLGLLWVRYQGREHKIKTEQRKYGRR